MVWQKQLTVSSTKKHKLSKKEVPLKAVIKGFWRYFSKKIKKNSIFLKKVLDNGIPIMVLYTSRFGTD
jgi:hypothetical protein